VSDLHDNDAVSTFHLLYESFYTKVKKAIAHRKLSLKSFNLAASIPRTFSTSAVLLDVVAVPLTPKNKHYN